MRGLGVGLALTVLLDAFVATVAGTGVHAPVRALELVGPRSAGTLARSTRLQRGRTGVSPRARRISNATTTGSSAPDFRCAFRIGRRACEDGGRSGARCPDVGRFSDRQSGTPRGEPVASVRSSLAGPFSRGCPPDRQCPHDCDVQMIGKSIAVGAAEFSGQGARSLRRSSSS